MSKPHKCRTCGSRMRAEWACDCPPAPEPCDGMVWDENQAEYVDAPEPVNGQATCASCGWVEGHAADCCYATDPVSEAELDDLEFLLEPGCNGISRTLAIENCRRLIAEVRRLREEGVKWRGLCTGCKTVLDDYLARIAELETELATQQSPTTRGQTATPDVAKAIRKLIHWHKGE